MSNSKPISIKLNYLAFSSTIIIALTQVIQRLYPILDNYYISQLGIQALLIHNIFYSFSSIAQYTSYAAVTTCLILWKDKNNQLNQHAIFINLLWLAVLSTVIGVSPFLILNHQLLTYFKVNYQLFPSSLAYFNYGLLLTIIFSAFYFITNTYNGINKYILSLGLSLILFIITWLINFIVIKEQNHANTSLIIMIMATKIVAIILLICIILYFAKIKPISNHGFKLNKSAYKIWISELLSGLITAGYPIVFIFQLGVIDKNNSLIVTYQLILQLTSLACIPLFCSSQANLAEASACNAVIKNQKWLKHILILGLIPTQSLLILILFFHKSVIQLLFNYSIPSLHNSYVVLFILATMIGQVGNLIIFVLRARKKSHLVTIIYYVSDIVFLLGITQGLIFLNISSPLLIGWTTLVYTIAYTLIAMFYNIKK